MLLQARLNVRKDLESSGRKGLEDNFHHCGGPVTPVHACFSVRRDLTGPPQWSKLLSRSLLTLKLPCHASQDPHNGANCFLNFSWHAN